MKLVEALKRDLLQHFDEVLVFDERGDGHFIELICISAQFEAKNLVERSRIIFRCLTDYSNKVHAWSVKGFTAEEWKIESANFTPQKYKHYR